MIRPGVDLQQETAGFEHPREFGIDGKAKEAQHAIERGRQHRQRRVAADHPGGVFVLLGRRLNRPFGDVQPEQAERRSGLRRRRCQLAQVVAFAAAGVEASQRGLGRGAVEHEAADGGSDRRVGAGVEEAAARRDHRLAVARVERALVLHRQQVDVTLAGEVETVAARAAQGGAVAVQGRAVERAGEGGKRGDVHGEARF